MTVEGELVGATEFYTVDYFCQSWLCRVTSKRRASFKDEIPFTFSKVSSCNLFVIWTYDASCFADRSDKYFKLVIPLFVQASSPLSKIQGKQKVDFLLKLTVSQDVFETNYLH